jgi:hypothetical protein
LLLISIDGEPKVTPGRTRRLAIELDEIRVRVGETRRGRAGERARSPSGIRAEGKDGLCVVAGNLRRPMRGTSPAPGCRRRRAWQTLSREAVRPCGNAVTTRAGRSGPCSIWGELRIVSTWDREFGLRKRATPPVFWQESTRTVNSLSGRRHEPEGLLCSGQSAVRLAPAPFDQLVWRERSLAIE